MRFHPSHPVVKLCLQGMAQEAQDQPAAARALFEQAWQTSTTDFERYLAAYYLARQQASLPDRIE